MLVEPDTAERGMPKWTASLYSRPLAAQADPWSGEVGVGYLATSGNSDTTSLNGKLALDYVSGPWKNAFAGSAINSSDDEGSTVYGGGAAGRADAEGGLGAAGEGVEDGEARVGAEGVG